jgi:hypothetical protein
MSEESAGASRFQSVRNKSRNDVCAAVARFDTRGVDATELHQSTCDRTGGSAVLKRDLADRHLRVELSAQPLVFLRTPRRARRCQRRASWPFANSTGRIRFEQSASGEQCPNRIGAMKCVMRNSRPGARVSSVCQRLHNSDHLLSFHTSPPHRGYLGDERSLR